MDTEDKVTNALDEIRRINERMNQSLTELDARRVSVMKNCSKNNENIRIEEIRKELGI